MLKFFGLLALALTASALPTQQDGQQGGWQQGGGQEVAIVQTGQGQVVQPIGTPGNPLHCYLAQNPSNQIAVTNSDHCPSGYVASQTAQPQPFPTGTGTQQPLEGAQGSAISCYLANNPSYQVSILAGQTCPIGYIPARPIATLHQSENFFTPVQWRNIKQQEFDQAEAAFNQAGTEADQAREFYNARLRAKADAATARAKALSALNLAKARMASAARDHKETTIVEPLQPVQPSLPQVAVLPASEISGQGQSQGQIQGQAQGQQPPQQTVVVQQPTQPVVVVQQPTGDQSSLQQPSGNFPQTANQLPPPFGQPIHQNQGQGQFGQPAHQGQIGQPIQQQGQQLGQPAPFQQGQLGQSAPLQQGQFGQPAPVQPQGQQNIITNLPSSQAQQPQQQQQGVQQAPIQQQNQPMEQGMQQAQNPRAPPQQVISIVQTPPMAQQPQQHQQQQNQLQ